MVQATINQQEERKQSTLKNLKYNCEKEREKVKGIFRFYECPGGTLSFVYRAYKWDPVAKYSLTDGETYEIPLGVARHLNMNGWYPVHHYTLDEMGKPSMRVNEKKNRFGFQSMDFMEPEAIGESRETELVTATPVNKKHG